MKQLTLSGTRKLNSTDFVKGTDDYSVLINALWRRERVGVDRQSFQKTAQQTWKSEYKGRRANIEMLVAGLRDSEDGGVELVNKAFITSVDDLNIHERRGADQCDTQKNTDNGGVNARYVSREFTDLYFQNSISYNPLYNA
jgi:hypothetical protein